MTNSTVLVTGGAGFIGSHVVEELLDRGKDVAVLDNLFAGEREYVPSAATLHEVDIRDQDEVNTTVTSIDPDQIIHLAAIHYIPYCNKNPEDAFDVNVMGTRHLLNAARSLSDLERIVYTSSAAVYPSRDYPHEETDMPGPMDIYGRTKLVGEDLCELFASETGVPVASARLFNVYGPRETNPHLIPAILDQIKDGSREVELGNLTPKRDFVYVEDVATALSTLIDAHDDGHRVYNVGSNQAWSVREVVDEVGSALGISLTIEQDEERVRESDRPHLCAKIDRITEETKWNPRTEFVEGLRRLID
ncbi:MAG: NAD-dependent epimerase/dehydratase family protein, partial [Halobacteriaceae archaeon]